jgi:hypothetical protein
MDHRNNEVKRLWSINEQRDRIVNNYDLEKKSMEERECIKLK